MVAPDAGLVGWQRPKIMEPPPPKWSIDIHRARSLRTRGLGIMSSATKDITNALSIDLEDWGQSALGTDLPITTRVVRNTDRILALLDRHGVRATFFALGKVCERFPKLLPTIASAGHEIGTHGYGHELVYSISPDHFRADLQLSIAIIAAQIGRRPIGYRAPAFSITRQSLWAGPIMAELGIKYSSSIFPIAGRRYGIPDAPRFPFRWSTCDLIEFPLSTLRRCNRNLPVCGGGYLRLLPGAILSSAIREVNRLHHPAVVYMHPYELDIAEPAVLRRNGWPITWRKFATQSMFRGRVAGRLGKLLSAFRFAPLADVLGIAPDVTVNEKVRHARSLPILEFVDQKPSLPHALTGRLAGP